MLSALIIAAAISQAPTPAPVEVYQWVGVEQKDIHTAYQKSDASQKGVSVDVSRGRVAVRARRAAVRVERRRWFGRRACRNGRCG